MPPRHFYTPGKTIDQIPLEWLFGPGVVVDVSEVGELGIYTPEMIEEKVEVNGNNKLPTFFFSISRYKLTI